MINRGIKYDDLSAEQREQLEKVWEYEKAMKGIPKEKEYHRDIQGNEIFNYLINDDTIDNVLSELMTNGLKVHSGEDVARPSSLPTTTSMPSASWSALTSSIPSVVLTTAS